MNMHNNFLVSESLQSPQLEKGVWYLDDGVARKMAYAVEHGCSIDVAIEFITKAKNNKSKNFHFAVKKLMRNEIIRNSPLCMHILKNI